MDFFSPIKKIHFIGIGGIAMSAMAKYMRHKGILVTGSDVTQSRITDDLEEKYDIHVYIGVQPENITLEHDMVVYSPAVPNDNLERQEARNIGIPEYSYPELLGEVMKGKTTITVSGTNGKTTTTTMVVELLKHLGLDPTAIVGEYLQKYNSNFVAGQSEYFVTEACEYKESFLNYDYDIAVITNITEDHLDYFKDLNHIQDTFKKFLSNKKGVGVLICNPHLEALSPIVAEAKLLGMTIIDYSQYLDEDLKLPIPGEHNLENAAAALGVLSALGLSIDEGREYLGKYFQGAKRRIEHVGITEHGALLLDDYAHNPEGLERLIQGLREFYPEKKVVMLFEPHLYSRTRDFKEAFGRALEQVDVLYLFPVYRAREERIPEEDYLLENYIDPTKVELIVVHDPKTFKELFESKEYDKNYIVITAGAGNIWQQGLTIKKNHL
ncbi:UDP-N-acetylmuramate--L-alanine ligase [Patescibacteria group bacterium]|nr:UDP-N-acetylmuramate--L-alanine ligase [Patescibacteria group bacterium]